MIKSFLEEWIRITAVCANTVHLVVPEKEKKKQKLEYSDSESARKQIDNIVRAYSIQH